MTMELRAFAERVFFGSRLEDKLRGPTGGLGALEDRAPGRAWSWELPGRPEALAIAPRERRVRMPRDGAMSDARMRRRALHAFANHELMALELMAWALLAFPEAPPPFRLGVARLLADEQRHLGMYLERIEALGGEFGEDPVNGHFFRVAPELGSELRWVCAMNLTFEQANLDHAPHYCQLFQEAGDEASAALMEQIYADEVQHVGFGAGWLRQAAQRQGRPTWDVWRANLPSCSPASRARGRGFNQHGRREAGLDEAYVEALRGQGP